MRTIRRQLSNIRLSYPLEREVPLSRVLFIDIETTGFAAGSSVLYLIGCAYCEYGQWNTIQWLADSPEEEKNVIAAFFDFAMYQYTHLIHFNGNNFDLPFIIQKCRQYGLPWHFSDFTGIDLYRRTAPFREFLRLPNCKQKTLEQFLDLYRDDPYDGGQLIDIYHDYVNNHADTALNAIIRHNADDLAGVFHILPVLAYGNIFSAQTKVKKVQANRYQEMDGTKRQELFMKLSFPAPLPKEIFCSAEGCYFSGNGGTGTLRIPLYEEEMKYFYSNYPDYYYLPLEDNAIHKSIAKYADRQNRTQAKAYNCYTRKYSTYLPQWDIVFEPFFKRDYKSPDLFFEVTDSLKKDRAVFQAYAQHVLKMMAVGK